MTRTISALLALPLLIPGCLAEDENSDIETDFRAAAADELPSTKADISTYYIVTRRDFRRCVFPLCGGVYVARINKPTTTCADGTQAAECYVAATDLSATGLNEDQQGDFRTRFESSLGLVRGELVQDSTSYPGFEIGVLQGTEAWDAASDLQPLSTRNTWRADDTGLVCFTEPCINIQAGKLNTRRFRDIAGVDLDVTEAPEDLIDQGYADLHDGTGVMVSGRFVNVSGPAGTAKALEAEEFYLRVEPAAVGGDECEVTEDCDAGNWCGWGDDNVTRECKPFATEGDSCGGFVLPSFRAECEPGLECECVEPTCDVPGICTDPGPSACEDNDDCPTGEWCGYASDPADRECKPFAAIGDSCGGFTLPEFVEACEPGVECVNTNPFIADAPGTCFDLEATYSCTDDADCFGVAWCGWDADENRVCEQFQQAGDSCGGFVPVSDAVRCAPHLTCDIDPSLPDAPGTCVF